MTEFEQEWQNVPWTPQKKKKTFIMECRYIGPRCTWYEWNREWHTYRKYATERALNEALRAMSRRRDSFRPYERRWEYRILQ